VLPRPKHVERFSVRFPRRVRHDARAGVRLRRRRHDAVLGYGASRRHGHETDSGRETLESSGDESLFIDDAQLLNAEE
jgi:hypothetical protein